VYFFQNLVCKNATTSSTNGFDHIVNPSLVSPSYVHDGLSCLGGAPDVDDCAFQGLVLASIKQLKSSPSRFIKNLDEIPKIMLPSSTMRKKSLALAYHGLIGEFTGIWPFPKKYSFGFKKTESPSSKDP
jgi:hypothetical protein